MEKMRNKPIRFCMFLGALCILVPSTFTPNSWAATQTPAPDSNAKKLGALSIEELLDVPVFDETVTSVTKQTSDVRHSPAAVFVITSDMIRRSGATVIPELLRMAPGITVGRMDGNKWAIGIRGFTDRFVGKVLVQMDGRTLYNSINAGVYWDTAADYPLENIERIEVIRGPGASVWGANAVNGVINIISKSTHETHGGLISGGGGNIEQGFGTVRYGGKIGDKLNYRAYSKGFKRGQEFSGEGNPNDQWWGVNTGGTADWAMSDKDVVNFDAGYLRSDAGRNDTRPLLTAPFKFNNVEDEYSNGAHLLSRLQHKSDEDSNWSLQGYWDRFERYTTNRIFDFDVNTFDLDFQQQFPVGDRQKINYGAGYRINHNVFRGTAYDNAFAIGPLIRRRNFHTASAFLQDELALLQDKLTLIAGAKFEYNNNTGVEVQPTGRILWTPTEKQSVWAAFSRAVRTPALLENDVQIGLLGGPTFPQIQPNKELKPEKLFAYELGYRVEPTSKITLDTSFFYNKYYDLFTTVTGDLVSGPVAGTFVRDLNRENRLKGETYGVEVSSTWKAKEWWRLTGNYSFLRMQLHRKQGIPLLPASAEAAEGQSPRQQVYVQSSWDLPHHVELDLMGRYVDALRGFNLTGITGVRNKVAPYLSLDARIAWTINKNWEISAVGQNLINAHHAEFGTSPLVQSPVTEMERSFYGKVIFRWGED